MGRVSAILAGAVSALLAASSVALAFQETPEAPPPEAGEAALQAVPPPLPPGLQIQTPDAGTEPEKTGARDFNFGFLPKLDFGLEVLYGDSQQQQLELQPGALPDDTQDVSVVGKIKRRF